MRMRPRMAGARRSWEGPSGGVARDPAPRHHSSPSGGAEPRRSSSAASMTSRIPRRPGRPGGIAVDERVELGDVGPPVLGPVTGASDQPGVHELATQTDRVSHHGREPVRQLPLTDRLVHRRDPGGQPPQHALAVGPTARQPLETPADQEPPHRVGRAVGLHRAHAPRLPTPPPRTPRRPAPQRRDRASWCVPELRSRAAGARRPWWSAAAARTSRPRPARSPARRPPCRSRGR